MIDEKTEIKMLGAIFEDTTEIIGTSESMFTDIRLSTYKVMKNLARDGTISPEGLELALPNYPREILSISVTDSAPLKKQLTHFARKRSLLELSKELEARALSDDPNFSMTEFIEYTDETDLESNLIPAGMKFLENTQNKVDKRYEFVNTGFNFLNTPLGGEWPRKEISVIVANPGGSKTTLACCSMLEMADKNKHASLLISQEMATEMLHMRWAANLTMINGDMIKAGKLDTGEWDRVQEATNYIHTLPLYVIDRGRLTIDEIIACIYKYVRRYNVKTVFIDYLQIIKIETDNKHRELGKATELLKEVANRLNIHICILSQKNSKEGAWMIRDSGDVPANIDILIQLEPEDTASPVKHVKVTLQKNRNGALGIYPAIFDGEHYKYREAS